MKRRLCGTNDRPAEWYTTAGQLPDDWDGALPEAHFLRRASLAAHEAAALPHIQTRYVAVRAQDQIVVQAAFQVLTLQPEHISPASLSGWQRTAWRAFSGTAKPRLLVAGQLFRHDIATLFWNPQLSSFEAFNAYRGLIREALRAACAHAVLVKDTPDDLVPYFQHYAPEYLLLRNDSSMQMAIQEAWTSLADYEKSLKHKYAQRLRKVRQAAAGLAVRELDAAAVKEQAAAIHQLYLQVTANQPVRLGVLSEAFLPALKGFYGDQLRVWGFYEGERLVAFASAWVQRRSLDMFYIGFDYARNNELQLYFNILFFAIRQAVDFRKPLLILGRTALEAKARVGCKPVYLHTFLYVKNPAIRAIVGALQQRFTEPAGEWENRHPFKQ